MFHVELRKRPHVARAFNLNHAELRQRFVDPYLAGRSLLHADREWAADKVKLTIYEGRELRPEEIGLGRGWGNVLRSGSDVTERELDRSAVQPTESRAELIRLKDRLLGRLAAGSIGLGEAVQLADDLLSGGRASARLALTELAVWEVLHEGLAILVGAPGDIPREAWEAVLLEWATWGQATTSSIRLARSASEANR